MRPSEFKRAKLVVLMTTCLTLSSLVLANPYPAQDNVVQVQAGQSIQKAIDAAKAGAQIAVAPGTYTEQVTISTDGITLIGEGVVLIPPETPVQNTCTGLAGNDTHAGICIEGSGVKLAEFVREHRKLISLDQPVKNIYVSGFQVNGFSGANIAVVGGQNVHITNNWFYNGGSIMGGYGILSVGSIGTSVTHNVVVLENDIGFIGLCMDNPSPASVLHNRISGYVIGYCIQTNGSEIAFNDADNCCIGIFVDPGIASAKLLHNYIHAANETCGLIESVNGGVILDGSSNTTVQFNVIEGQRANGTGGGILLVDATEVSPTVVANGNLISGNVLRENDYNVYFNSTGVGNVVDANQCDIKGDGCA